jgi:uncharacterized protein YutE (UPF0331/DUF86 family)
MSVAARKIATIVRCVERARSERHQAGQTFRQDFTRQDAAVLNITRACEAAIDLANMLIRARKLGVPGEARESFAILEREHLIPTELSGRLQKMVGFRNIAVHQYEDLDLDIVDAVICKGLDDVLAFAEAVRTPLSTT